MLVVIVPQMLLQLVMERHKLLQPLLRHLHLQQQKLLLQPLLRHLHLQQQKLTPLVLLQLMRHRELPILEV
jgi:hypothetical protein